ncbi:MAG: MBL fold metallo-hydrolase [Firmicutes bacterium]|nr:MBL fold metallo-hydrolase [Bacillota bacterium]
MDLKLFYTGPMQVNTYLCVNEETKKGFLVDPGGPSMALDQYLESNDYDIEYIILTHGHGDHICGVPYYKEMFNCPIVGHRDDIYLFNDAKENLSTAFMGAPIEFIPDIFVEDGDMMEIAGMKLLILHTPGHTPGGISILIGNILFSGDTLFADSIGRTDFKGGSFAVLKKAVHTKLFVLPDDTFVLPGHMGTTTIGHEKKYNPFL